MSKSRYDFTDTESGNKVQGAKIQFCALEREIGENAGGYSVTTANMPFNEFENIGVLPAIYDVDLSFMDKRVGNKSVAVVVIAAVGKMISAVDIHKPAKAA